MQFTPTEDFYSEEMESQYLKGMTYTVREVPSIDYWNDGMVPNYKLAGLVKKWLKEGKVTEVLTAVDGNTDTVTMAPAKVSGKGKVK